MRRWRRQMVPEEYATRFVPIPDSRRRAAVLDRGYEYAQRSGDTIEWRVEEPDVLRAKRAASSSSAIELRVVSREIEAYQAEPPYGFGFVEVVTLIEEEAPASAAAIARVSRRIAPSDDGIDGTETVATYSTLEAMKRRPTSTTRSQIRLRRSGGPPRMLAEEEEEEEEESGGGYEEDDEEIEAARVQLERLVQQGQGGGGGGGGSGGGFRFEGQGGKEAATPKVIDDVAAGLSEAQDIGRRGLGLSASGNIEY